MLKKVADFGGTVYGQLRPWVMVVRDTVICSLQTPIIALAQ